MPIVKKNHALQEVRLIFNAAGEVNDVTLAVSYSLSDDVSGELLTPVGKSKSVWTSLTPGQQGQLSAIGKVLLVLAKGF